MKLGEEDKHTEKPCGKGSVKTGGFTFGISRSGSFDELVDLKLIVPRQKTP